MRRGRICLPTFRRIPPTARVNPADAPIMILGLTSENYDVTQVYDQASTVMAQKLSQMNGVGQVFVFGGATPAVRVEVDPKKLESFGLTLGSVQSTLSLQNSHSPRGQLSDGTITQDIITNDQISEAAQYKPLVIGYRRGAAVRLEDVADVIDSAQDLRNAGYLDGTRAVFAIVFRQPGANIIETVDRIKSQLPFLEAVLPQGIKTTLVMDRTVTIRASVQNVERTLIGSIILVVLVVFVFLRSPRATLIPSVAVPVSLIGTFAVMYLLGYTLDNLSLMALTVATGFVVDDAIVVMENITRHLENGMEPFAASLQGAKEIGFTVFLDQHVADRGVHSHSHDGRHRRAAVPRVRSRAFHRHRGLDGDFADHHADHVRAPAENAPAGRAAQRLLSGEREILYRDARHLQALAYLGARQSGFDHHRAGADDRAERGGDRQNSQRILSAAGHRAPFMGGVQGPQDASFPFMNFSMQQLVAIIKADPAVEHVNAYTGGRGS